MIWRISLLIILPAFLNAQIKNRTIKIQRNVLENPLQKEGWDLVFHDEFSGNYLDTLMWNKSTLYDDIGVDEKRSICMNPANVRVENGYCVLRMDTANASGASFSSAEIKTFSTKNENFPYTKIESNSLIEFRVRIPWEQGVGVGLWLYQDYDKLPYNEIDLIETSGNKGDEHTFRASYHWTTREKLDGRCFESNRIKLFDEKTNKKIPLKDIWLTFTCEWNNDSIKVWVNNELGFTVDTKSRPRKPYRQKRFEEPIFPLIIRAGISGNGIGKKMPFKNTFTQAEMLIDYIRVYTKEKNPIYEIDKRDRISKSNAGNFQVKYIAGVRYEWLAPDFELTENPSRWSRSPACKMARPKPYTVVGKQYPIQLKATLPSGKVQYFEWNVLME